MDPAIIVAVIAALQVIYQAWTKYAASRKQTNVDLSANVDKRMATLLEAQQSELERLRNVERQYIELLKERAGIEQQSKASE